MVIAICYYVNATVIFTLLCSVSRRKSDDDESRSSKLHKRSKKSSRKDRDTPEKLEPGSAAQQQQTTANTGAATGLPTASTAAPAMLTASEIKQE